MNAQRDILTGPSVVFSHAFSLRRGSKRNMLRLETSSSAGFEEIHPRSAKVELKSKIENRKSKIGFTLVELLMIVGIIALLVGMLLPALNRFRLASARAKTQSAINLIDGACQYYFNDFDNYPPSNDANYPGWYGGQLLVLFLTGYGPDWEATGVPNGVPFEGGRKLNEDDGVEGYGFRLAQRGDVYGPYNGCEKLETKKSVRNNLSQLVDTYPFFVDTFDNCILYYRFTGTTYNSSDNRGDNNKKGADGPTDVNDYAKNTAGAYYRADFILISSGNNQQWNAPKDGDSDDVTNFFNK